MTKKKVTLSLDSRVYLDFQKYCEENAIMLSKRLEVVMRNILKSKKKNIFLFFGFSIIFVLALNFASASSFIDKNASDFNNGAYANTSYNVNSIILNGTNISGTYTSRIFDTGAAARWNNLSYYDIKSIINSIFAVDVNAAIYYSADNGTNFVLKNSSYVGTTPGDTINMFSDSTSLYIIKSSARQIYRSDDQGKNWNLVNGSFSNRDLYAGIADSSYIYVFVGTGAGYRSSDKGISWSVIADFNGGAGNNPLGATVNLTNGLFVVDSSGNVYSSTDSGITWNNVNAGYGRTSDTQAMFSDSLNNLYILANANREVYRSNNSGVNWTLVNNSFSGSKGLLSGIGDNYGNIYVIAGTTSGTVYKSVNKGVSWIQVNNSYNNGNGNTKGMASLILRTNLTYQIRNCSSANCSDGNWQNFSLTNINLTGRYFQYKGYFISQDNSITPKFYNISIDYSILNAAPLISIISPIFNNNYGFNQSIDLNFSASDSDNNLQSCWYNINNGVNNSLTNCQNTSFRIAGNGTYTLNLYANDSLGLISNASVNFNVLDSAPSLLIIYPQEGDAYGFNSSISLSFSVSDVDNNLQSCWYNINNGINVSLVNCQNNTRFNVSGNGNYVVNVFANDSLGFLTKKNVSFSVNIGAPSIVLNFPVSVYLNYRNVTFSYVPSDIDLQSCELWGNFDGTFKLNQTQNPVNNQNNYFYLNLSDGNYLWNVKCNDSQGHSTFNGNKSFYVDATVPVVNITEPVGKKTNRSGLAFNFNVSDANMQTCWYNVYRGVNVEIQNTTINCSASNSFNVTVDADFVLNLYVNDSAGNLNFSSSSFSVDTSVPSIPSSGGSSGGGGGGGGSSSSVVAKAKVGELEISSLGNLIVHGGDKKSLSLNARNVGKIFLNNCKLLIAGEISSWFYSNQIDGIAPGENKNFIFDLNVPEGIEEKDYSGQLEVECEEVSQFTSFVVSVPKNPAGIEIKEIKQAKNNLQIIYTINSDVEKSIDIWLADKDGKEIKKIKDNGKGERIISMELNENLVGIYSIYFAPSSDLSNFVKQSVVLGKSSTTGFSILDQPGNKMIGYIVFVLIIFVAVFFIVRSKNQEIHESKHRTLFSRKEF